MSTNRTAASKDRVTRADLEIKMREIVDELETPAAKAVDVAKVAAVVAVVGIVAMAYFFGKRKGKRSSAIVELRRF